MSDGSDHETRLSILEREVKTMREDFRSDFRELGKAMNTTIRDGFKSVVADSRRDNGRVSDALDELTKTVTKGQITDAKQDTKIAAIETELGGYRQKLATLDEASPVILPSATPDAAPNPKNNAALAALTAAAVALAGAATAALHAYAG